MGGEAGCTNHHRNLLREKTVADKFTAALQLDPDTPASERLTAVRSVGKFLKRQEE